MERRADAPELLAGVLEEAEQGEEWSPAFGGVSVRTGELRMESAEAGELSANALRRGSRPTSRASAQSCSMYENRVCGLDGLFWAFGVTATADGDTEHEIVGDFLDADRGGDIFGPEGLTTHSDSCGLEGVGDIAIGFEQSSSFCSVLDEHTGEITEGDFMDPSSFDGESL